jgi:putrescine transport system substrate-binding protein
MLAIPADAPNPDAAHQFINYLLDPEVAAQNSNYVFYANAVPESLPMVVDEVKNDPAIYPPEEVKENLFALEAHSARFDRQLTRAFTRLKTGR